ncbi:MAG: helix-turn-helix transcriptional regulator [Oribacterium sp.]|nr:helix-turn-helix transcriptional regulator [Oribacterium sp.]
MIRLRIKEILEEQNHTKYWLQKQLGETSYRNLSRLVNNEVISIRLETIEKLITVLQCTPGDLFEKIEEDEN